MAPEAQLTPTPQVRLDQPTLSIGLPTFERAGSLAVLLEDLTHLLESTDEIEIVIADNASADGTSALIRDWLSELPRLHRVVLIRQGTNVGPARNLVSTMRASTGAFFSFVGDDDRVDVDRAMALVGWLGDHPTTSAVVASRAFDHDDAFSEIPLDVLADKFYEFGNAWSGIVDGDLLRAVLEDADLVKHAEGTIWPQLVLGYAAILRSLHAGHRVRCWSSRIEFGRQGDGGTLTFVDHEYLVRSLEGLVEAATAVDRYDASLALRRRMVRGRNRGVNEHIVGLMMLSLIGAVSSGANARLRSDVRKSRGASRLVYTAARAASCRPVVYPLAFAAVSARRLVNLAVLRRHYDSGRDDGVRSRSLKEVIASARRRHQEQEERYRAGEIR